MQVQANPSDDWSGKQRLGWRSPRGGIGETGSRCTETVTCLYAIVQAVHIIDGQVHLLLS